MFEKLKTLDIKKSLVFNLFLLIAAGVVILFVGEGVARIFCKESSLLTPDPTFHHVHNKRICHQRKSPKGEYNVLVKFNSHGFRDYDYSFKKPENTTRIIVLGDSYVDALEVELEETFIKRLEKKLNRNNREGHRYEVINLGIQGYSTLLEYLVLKNIGLKFDPDLIITCFHFTDIAEDYIYSQMLTLDRNELPVCVRHPSFSQKKINFFVKDFLRSHSQLYVLARAQYHNLLNKMGLEKKSSRAVYPVALENLTQRVSSQDIRINPYAIFKDNYSLEDEQAWELTYGFLRKIKSLADISDSKLVLIIIPAPDQVASYEVKEGKKAWAREEDSFILSSKMQECLIKFCRQNGIEVLDLLPALRRASLPERPLFFAYDGHFNSRGHMVVVDEIYNYLKNK